MGVLVDENEKLEESSEEVVENDNEEVVDQEGVDENEESADDAGDDAQDESSEDDSNEEVEIYESEAAYLKAKGVSDEIETLDGLVEAYLTKPKEPTPSKAEEKPEPVRTESSSEGQQTAFGRTLAKTHVDTILKNGSYDKGQSGNLRSFATLTDGILDPLLDKVEFLMGTMHQQLEAVTADAKNGSWARFKNRGYSEYVSRDQLDELLGGTNNLNYEQAFRELVTKDPDLFAKFTNSLKGKGGKGGKKGTVKRFSSARRGASANKGGVALKPYLTPTGALDESKLNVLSVAKREKIVDQYLASFEKSSG